MKKYLTKKEVVESFKENILSTLDTDIISKKEAWNNFTDLLCKDDLINQHQYNTWVYPSCVKH